MTGNLCITFALITIVAVGAQPRSEPCNVRARTDSGVVCGLWRRADDNSVYASFRGVPYAKQPVGELRFKELEPAEPWKGELDARNEGPVCFQTDVFYGKIMQARERSEACIYANIHVPRDALPTFTVPATERKIVKGIQSPRQTVYETTEKEVSSGELSRGLPILVFVHGGGFAFGSGDTDLHGPEYLVSKNVIVITFNYRLNVFGFLSLNSTKVPGNAGLRDVVTLLRWVRRNAHHFGGDPRNVTLAGQSAGAIAAHILTMSKAAEGLFQRAILMSGTAITGFYSPSPYFAQYMTNQLLTALNINGTDSDVIHKQLIDLPAEKLWEANQFLIDQLGFTTFVPTVETSFPGITPILSDYPDVLLAKGYGKDIPLLVGYTNSECETFRPRLEEFDLVQKSKENPFIIVPSKVIFTTAPSQLPYVAKKIDSRYYNGTISVDGFVNCCTDGFYEYPVIKLVEERNKVNEADIYVYKFEYESDNSVFKQVGGLKYHGAGHVEDLTYIFKVNSVVDDSSYPPKNEDDNMKYFMTNFFVNFMNCSKPICKDPDNLWPVATTSRLQYQDIHTPNVYQTRSMSPQQQDITRFFDTLTTIQ